MSREDFIAAARRFQATEYLHHRRMVAVCRGFGGEDYHRRQMIQARRNMLSLRGTA